MEGLAITPDGKTLVGSMQVNLQQDKKKSLRIVTIDIAGGATHEYAYQPTDGSGVSDIVAINNHQFLVDERKGNGMADTPLPSDTASPAEAKEFFVINLDGAQDVTAMSGDLSGYAVPKTLSLDFVAKLNTNGIDSYMIPSKIEGLSFGQDVIINGVTKHTLFAADDNDFLATIANPNQFYVFAFDDGDLPGFAPQKIREMHGLLRNDDDREDWQHGEQPH